MTEHINNYNNEDEISLIEILAVLWRYRWFLLVFNIIVIGGSAIGYKLLKYTKESTNSSNSTKISVIVNSFPEVPIDKINQQLNIIKDTVNNDDEQTFNMDKIKKINNTCLSIEIIKKRPTSTKKLLSSLRKLINPIFSLEYFRQTIVNYKDTLNSTETKTKKSTDPNLISLKNIYRDLLADKIYYDISRQDMLKNNLSASKAKINKVFKAIYKDPNTIMIQKDLEQFRKVILNLFSNIVNNYNISLSIQDSGIVATPAKSLKIVVAVFTILSFFLSVFIIFLLEYYKANKEEIKAIFKS